MKKSIWIIVILAIAALYAVSAYNGMVGSQEEATKSWANVQSAYQRRADLIPNLVETTEGYARMEWKYDIGGRNVKEQRYFDADGNYVNGPEGYAKHEEETFKGVVEARAKATQITVDPENLTPEKLQEYQKAQGELGAALGKLIAIQENYPELKANENFKDLQVQLEGTENRINEARNKFNNAVQDYNVTIRQFPKNLFAGIFGFIKMEKFEADADAQNAPKVKF